MSESLSLANIPAGPDLAAKLAELSGRRSELDGPQLVELMIAAQRQSNWTESVKVSAANELAYCPPSIFEQDSPRTSSRSELVPGVLEVALGWGRYVARRFDNDAYLLSELFPATLDALRKGMIDLLTARAIAEGLAVIDNLDLRHRLEAETLTWLRTFADRGRKITARGTGMHVEKEVIKHDPAAAKRRHKDRVRTRGVRMTPSVDSVADLTIHDLPADQATEIFNRIDALAKGMKQHCDERTLGQLRADLAGSLLLGQSRYVIPDDHGPVEDSEPASTAPTAKPAPMLPTGPIPVRAKNILHISLTELLGLNEAGKHDPAILGGFGPVIDEVARRVLENHLGNPLAEYEIVVTHPQTGKPLQLHPVDARLFRGRRRDVVNIRWPTCSWPTGCSRPAQTCVTDHSHDYALGGKTIEINGNPLCDAHDREKTKNGWRQQRVGTDVIIWISPFGHRIPVEAPTYTEPDPGPGKYDGSPPF